MDTKDDKDKPGPAPNMQPRRILSTLIAARARKRYCTPLAVENMEAAQ